MIKALEAVANNPQIISSVGAFIGSVGFPVALTIGLLYYLFKVQKEHKEEVNALKDAINNLNLNMSSNNKEIKDTIASLTLVIDKILERI